MKINFQNWKKLQLKLLLKKPKCTFFVTFLKVESTILYQFPYLESKISDLSIFVPLKIKLGPSYEFVSGMNCLLHMLLSLQTTTVGFKWMLDFEGNWLKGW